MTHKYNDQELFDLFHENLPAVQLPPELAAKLHRHVMAEVAETAEAVRRADEISYLASVSQEKRPVERTMRSSTEPTGFWQGAARVARSLRWAPSLTLAGATVAVALFFFYLVPSLYPPGGTPETPSTGSGESAPAMLAPITATAQTALATIENGNATLLRAATSEIQDLGPGSQVEMWVGDELITLTGDARIDYFVNQSSYVDPGSRVELRELDEQNNGTQVTIELFIGRTRHEINGPLTTSDRFEVRTPSSAASAVGTEFVVDALSQSETYYAVFSGMILVEMGEKQIEVAAGEQLEAVQNQPLVKSNIVYDPTPTPEAVALGEDPVDPTEEPTPEPTETEIPSTSTSTPTDTPESTVTATPVPTYTPEPTAVDTDTPEPTATSTETAIPTSTATDTPEPTETPTATPTATETPEPTEIPTETPTATPTATDTPEPTETATVIPTSTPTDTPEPTAISTATSIPTATPPPPPIQEPNFVEVSLIVPNDRVSGAGETTFSWAINGVLPPDQGYELTFWRVGDDPLDQGFGLAQPTRNDSVTVNLDSLDDRLGGLFDAGEYYWGVRLVNVAPYERLTMSDEARLFRYRGGDLGGSGPVPGD